MIARFSQYNVDKYIQYKKLVKSVVFDEATKTFKVAVKDLATNTVTTGMEFDYVINASGHFSTPNMPDFNGKN